MAPHGFRVFKVEPRERHGRKDAPWRTEAGAHLLERFAALAGGFVANEWILDATLTYAQAEALGILEAKKSIGAGDKVVMWYESANRDERVFDDPGTFDVTRTPNEHVGFGGGGPHFCLGANLARREIRVAFEELRRQVPDIVATDEPAILESAFIHGIKRLQVGWTPPG